MGPSLRPRTRTVGMALVAMLPELVAMIALAVLLGLGAVTQDTALPVIWVILGVRLGLLRRNGGSSPPGLLSLLRL